MHYLAIMRHGQSETNLAGIIAGTTETKLTDHGKLQARQMAHLIHDYSFQAGYCSTLGRARQTWVEVAAELDLELEPTSAPELREINWGVLNGKPLPYEKILMQEHPEWFGWEGRTPGGESYAEAYARVSSYYDSNVLPTLLQGKNTLLVAHAGILKTLQGHLENISFEHYPSLDLRNCSVKVYGIDEAGIIRSINAFSLPPQPDLAVMQLSTSV